MTYQFQFRRGTALQWQVKNPVLEEGEPGFERGGKLKIGDGVTPWNDLPYTNANNVPIDLQEHIDNATPHPIYDDGPSLVLAYENAKV